MDIESAIKKCPFFSTLSDEEIKPLKAIGRERRCSKGEVIFIEGQEARGFFLVISGRVKIYKLSADGREQILKLADPAETIAEAAVFAGNVYPASAQALEPSLLLFFPKDDFQHLLQTHPRLSQGIIRDFARRLRHFASLVEDLSLKDVASRLARFLLSEAQAGGLRSTAGIQIKLKISRRELASRLGTVPETLSRSLNRLSSAGVIKVKGRELTILDRKALEKIAAGAEE